LKKTRWKKSHSDGTGKKRGGGGQGSGKGTAVTSVVGETARKKTGRL